MMNGCKVQVGSVRCGVVWPAMGCILSAGVCGRKGSVVLARGQAGNSAGEAVLSLTERRAR